jgi:hypothetical protein
MSAPAVNINMATFTGVERAHSLVLQNVSENMVLQFDVKLYFRVTATMLQIRCGHCPRSKASLSLEPHRRTAPALGGELGGVKHSFTQH